MWYRIVLFWLYSRPNFFFHEDFEIQVLSQLFCKKER